MEEGVGMFFCWGMTLADHLQNYSEFAYIPIKRLYLRMQMSHKLPKQPLQHPKSNGRCQFYSPENKIIKDIRWVSSIQKKIILCPPHRISFSPNKTPQIPIKQAPPKLNPFLSFGSKSCTRINRSNFNQTNIPSQPLDSSSNNEKPHYFLNPNLISRQNIKSRANVKSRDGNTKQEKNQQKADKTTYPLFLSNRFNSPNTFIPKIHFSNKTSESSEKKSSPYALSEMANSTKSNDKSQTKVPENTHLFVPIEPRPKTQSLRKIQSSTRLNKVPSFIRLKQQQSTCINKYDSISYQMRMNQSANNHQQIQPSSYTVGFQFKISIKPAIKKRSFNDFEVIKELGTGSFGKACLAIQKKIGFICVIKIIQKNMVNQYEIKSLMREIKIQSFLDHLHTTSLYGFFDDEEKVYLILELLPTPNLKAQTKGKALPENKVSSIIFQVLSAIEYMHNNSIIHRDIKPQNIFTFDNYMRLGDFGCAVYCEERRRSFVGSPCYLSPEQLRNEDYDDKVDVWQIGILTYELLYKVSPFERDILAIIQGEQTPGELSELCFPRKNTVSQQAKDFMRKTLRKKAQQRITVREALSHPFLRSQLQQYQQLRSCHI